MRIGLQISDFTWPGAPPSIGPTFRRVAGEADAAGMASLWVMDHFFQIRGIGPPEHEMLEAYSALAHAAAVTTTITLGTMVTGVTYRYPGLLLKTVTTLDVLSGGRAWLGIGAAWNEQEHRGLGVPFPGVSERFERLVAQYADACNIFDAGPDAVRAKYDVIRGHCESVGRAYDEVEKTVLSRVDLRAESVDQVVERFGRLDEVGTDHVVIGLAGVHEEGAFEQVPELVRQVSALGRERA